VKCAGKRCTLIGVLIQVGRGRRMHRQCFAEEDRWSEAREALDMSPAPEIPDPDPTPREEQTDLIRYLVAKGYTTREAARLAGVSQTQAVRLTRRAA
jgi:hypothetical protein